MGVNKNRGRRVNKSFVMLSRRMLESQEWKDLGAAAKLFYTHLKARFNGRNNGQIRLPYSKLKGIKGLSSDSTISKARKELEEKGWIKRAKCGGLYRYQNEFKLTGKYDEDITLFP